MVTALSFAFVGNAGGAGGRCARADSRSDRGRLVTGSLNRRATVRKIGRLALLAIDLRPGLVDCALYRALMSRLSYILVTKATLEKSDDYNKYVMKEEKKADMHTE
ncbi:unnamed protein product, partial [Iphiclides podalirius]